MLLIQDLAMQAGYLLPALLPALLVTAAWQMWSGRQRPFPERLQGIWKQKWLLLFWVYLFAMLISALISRPETDPSQNVFSHMWFGRDEKWNNEIIENILFFIPHTLLFLLAFRPAKPLRAALLLSLATTVLIEAGQLVFWRGAFQVSDILYNMLGGFLGWGLFRLAGLCARPADQTEN